MENLFSDVGISKYYENQAKLCEENLIDKNLYNSLKSMQSDKSPGKDGLTKECYGTFRTELTEILVDSVSEAKEEGILSTSQKQAIIKLIAKKDKRSEIHSKLETHFIIECRFKNDIKSSL